jgi:hypothetical protein
MTLSGFHYNLIIQPDYYQKNMNQTNLIILLDLILLQLIQNLNQTNLIKIPGHCNMPLYSFVESWSDIERRFHSDSRQIFLRPKK